MKQRIAARISECECFEALRAAMHRNKSDKSYIWCGLLDENAWKCAPVLNLRLQLVSTQALFQFRHCSRKRIKQAWQFDARMPALTGRKDFMKNLQFTGTRLKPA